jgi:fructose-bisphosphate aldolase class I
MHASGNFRDELIQTAKDICTPGRGILAADESTGTIAKRFQSINVENTRENRIAYRELLFTAPGIEEFISGVILYDETARDSASNGTNFVQLLRSRGIHAGIKVDCGLVNIAGTNEETATTGLDGLGKRCAEYYAMGCRFAKWRAVLKIGGGCPS